MYDHDDDLRKFEAEGAKPLPTPNQRGYVEHDGASIWYASYGTGDPVILLHGGLGHSGNWGYQVPDLLEHNYHVVVIDSRGHGRSTRDAQAYSYTRMATDVAAVMDTLDLARANLIGWSDGAVIALELAKTSPERVKSVFFFGCNVDPSGTKAFENSPVIERCFSRHAKDYAALSTTPEQFDEFVSAVNLMMETQPNYAAQDLVQIHVPVTVAYAELDEFIRPEHAEYLVQTLPNARLVHLSGVSHFAPLQRPEQFNRVLLEFLEDKYE
ncbi:MAG: alpha/beta hydrolase [Deinococcota bacterium]